MKVDAARNALVYGDAKPAQVVSGAVEPPPEFQVGWLPAANPADPSPLAGSRQRRRVR